MAMPKGHKSENGYATVKNGADYRTISEKMAEQGFKMNHATARNVFLSAQEKIAEGIETKVSDPDMEYEPTRIAKHPSFQAGIADLIRDLDSTLDESDI